MKLISTPITHVIFEDLEVLQQKARYSARKLLVKKLLYPIQDKQGQALVKEKIYFESTVSVPDIMRELTKHVTAYGSIPDELIRLYRVCKTEDRIIYACGSKTTQNFRASIIFMTRNKGVNSVFCVQNWTEKDGIVEAQDVIRNLVKEVKAAFVAADPLVNIMNN